MTLSGSRTVSSATWFLVTVVLAAICLAIANFGIVVTHTGNGGTVPYIVTLAVTAVISAILLFWALPRPGADRPRWALVLGILAIVTLVVYWSGLPFAFGIAAVAFGAQRFETAARWGMYLGAAAAVLAAVGSVVLA